MTRHKTFYILCAGLLFGICYNLLHSFISVSQTAQQEYFDKTIIIDAGHGGEDGGATSINNVLEKDINLEISLILRDIFIQAGYEVIMTREDDSDLADKNLNTVSQRKTSDMRNRLDLINNSEADLVISIHQNHFEDSKYSGAQMFYSDNITESKTLAEHLQSGIVSYLQTDNSRQAKEVDSKYLLENSKLPTVVIECGFLSNQEDSENLVDHIYQTKIAMSIFLSVSNYFQSIQ